MIKQDIINQLVQHKEVPQDISKVLTAGYNVNRLLDIFLNTMQEILKVARIAIVLKKEDNFRISTAQGISPDVISSISLSDAEGLMGYLQREGTALRLGFDSALDGSVVAQMRQLGVTTAVPLWEHGRLQGTIVFSNKITGSPVSDAELELVFTLGSQLSIAIENARLVEVISQQRNHLEGILEHVSSGVITVDAQGVVATYNPKAEEILGIAKKEVIGKGFSKLPQEVAELFAESMESEVSCSRRELKVAPLNRLIGVSITPIRDADAEVRGAVMIFTDLEPIKVLQQEARRADQLSFVNTVAMRSSHELKNCLVSIKTFAQLLPERYMDKQFREDFYLVVNKEVDRLNQLVENLLFFAQPLRLSCSSCDIEELLQEIIDRLETKDALLGITIQKEFAHRSGYIDVDRDAMLRALKSIIYNSVQAMPKGGKIRILSVDVSSEKQDYLELKIVDEGVGVAQESINKIWDPFFTTKARGIGLGLTIVRKIVEAHGGQVTISSEAQKGTEVAMLLPRLFQQYEAQKMFFPSGREVVV